MYPSPLIPSPRAAQERSCDGRSSGSQRQYGVSSGSGASGPRATAAACTKYHTASGTSATPAQRATSRHGRRSSTSATSTAASTTTPAVRNSAVSARTSPRVTASAGRAAPGPASARRYASNSAVAHPQTKYGSDNGMLKYWMTAPRKNGPTAQSPSTTGAAPSLRRPIHQIIPAAAPLARGLSNAIAARTPARGPNSFPGTATTSGRPGGYFTATGSPTR